MPGGEILCRGRSRGRHHCRSSDTAVVRLKARLACKDFKAADADTPTFLTPPEYDWETAIAETNNLSFYVLMVS